MQPLVFLYIYLDILLKDTIKIARVGGELQIWGECVTFSEHRLRLGNKNKSVLLFCIALALHYLCYMKKIIKAIMGVSATLRRYVSPVFVMLLCASFSLWYISKLKYNYTTEFEMKVNVEGQRFTVPCVVEGQGTNLLGYAIYTSRRIDIPLAELEYKRVRVGGEQGGEAGAEERVQIESASLQHAMSVRFSDIKIVSIGAVPEIEIPEQEK